MGALQEELEAHNQPNQFTHSAASFDLFDYLLSISGWLLVFSFGLLPAACSGHNQPKRKSRLANPIHQTNSTPTLISLIIKEIELGGLVGAACPPALH